MATPTLAPNLCLWACDESVGGDDFGLGMFEGVGGDVLAVEVISPPLLEDLTCDGIGGVALEEDEECLLVVEGFLLRVCEGAGDGGEVGFLEGGTVGW
eukprot:CAMPEP_0170166532 /NCGR_PEP_ID=MMETSP0040_2-20121228/186_1 /TAXON_ID=641309 /ORGANISM="Lotharella oceanica, Strain CCMP622" /LENGTH=97 /DNA_ID=CAMNT_0010404277 /DNA_START=654 /DNA_END=944 /DNA_ORIENTATION=+